MTTTATTLRCLLRDESGAADASWLTNFLLVLVLGAITWPALTQDRHFIQAGGLLGHLTSEILHLE